MSSHCCEAGVIAFPQPCPWHDAPRTDTKEAHRVRLESDDRPAELGLEALFTESNESLGRLDTGLDAERFFSGLSFAVIISLPLWVIVVLLLFIILNH